MPTNILRKIMRTPVKTGEIQDPNVLPMIR
jgi:hypothetical protein